MKKYLEIILNFKPHHLLVKRLLKVDKIKNDKIKHLIINELTKLIENINLKGFPENENLKKVIDIVEKILSFNVQQKGKGIKMLTPK